MTIAPNRMAVYLAATAALAGGLAPVVANLDLPSTGGLAAGLLAITVVTTKWLDGWQMHEQNKTWADVDRFHREFEDV